MGQVSHQTILELQKESQTARFTIVKKQTSFGISYSEKVLVLRGQVLGFVDVKQHIFFDMGLKKQVRVEKIDMATQQGQILLLRFKQNGKACSWYLKFSREEVAEEWIYMIWKVLNQGKQPSSLKKNQDGQRKINSSEGSSFFDQDSSSPTDNLEPLQHLFKSVPLFQFPPPLA